MKQTLVLSQAVFQKVISVIQQLPYNQVAALLDEVQRDYLANNQQPPQSEDKKDG